MPQIWHEGVDHTTATERFSIVVHSTHWNSKKCFRCMYYFFPSSSKEKRAVHLHDTWNMFSHCLPAFRPERHSSIVCAFESFLLACQLFDFLTVSLAVFLLQCLSPPSPNPSCICLLSHFECACRQQVVSALVSYIQYKAVELLAKA